jgi:hypothetical protein
MTVTMGTEDPVRLVVRRVYTEFPEVRAALMNPLRRRALFNLLIPLVAAGQVHNLEHCIARVYRDGFFVSKTAPMVAPRHRSNDHETSIMGAAAVEFRAGTQKAKLLIAYVAAGDEGLTAIEACRAADLSEKSCYWKRVSELNAAGLVERAEGYDGVTLTRPGDFGTPREVYVVTPFGRGRAAVIDDV